MKYLIDSQAPTKLGRKLSPLNARLNDGRTIEEAYQQAKGYSKVFGPGGGKGRPARWVNFDYEGEYQKLYETYAEENPDVISELAQLVRLGYQLVHPRARTSQNPATALMRVLAEGNER